jgi:catechol-2,3-dioxygenase
VSAAGAPPPDGVHHLAIQVSDLAAAEAFYGGVLGLAVMRRWPAADGAGERSIWMDAGGGAFVALERVPAGPPPRDEAAPGLHMLALRIARAARADWEARLAAANVAVVHRTSYTIYVRDPEGNRIGLSHWPDAAEG